MGTVYNFKHKYGSDKNDNKKTIVLKVIKSSSDDEDIYNMLI